MSVPRVCVLGGGVSGLSTAFFLRQKLGDAARVTVVDGARAFGGKVGGLKLQGDNDRQFHFELGPRSLIRRNGYRTLQMIDDLGLSDRILPANHDANRRFVYDGKQLRTVSLPWALQSSPLIGYHAAKEFLFGTPIGKDEAIFDFMARRFGVGTAEMMEPIVLGVFAGNIRKLSMRSCFPEMWDMAQERRGLMADNYSLLQGMLGDVGHGPGTAGTHGRQLLPPPGHARKLSMRSCFPEMWNMAQERRALMADNYSLLQSMLGRRGAPAPGFDQAKVEQWKKLHMYNFKDGGLEVLMKTMIKSLEDSNIEMLPNTFVQGIDLKSPISVKLGAHDTAKRSISTGESNRESQTREFDYVISTLPAENTARLISTPHANHDQVIEDLKSRLLSVQEAPIYVVYLAFDGQLIPKNKQGFGFLVPSRHNKDYLGITFDSCTFPEHNLSSNETRLSVMIGGDIRPDLCTMSESHVTEIALKAAAETLGITQKPAATGAWLSSIAQYPINHYRRVEVVESTSQSLHPNFVVSGSGLYGVSVNACVARAHNVATDIQSHLA